MVVKAEKDGIIVVIIKKHEKSRKGRLTLLSGTGHDFRLNINFDVTAWCARKINARSVFSYFILSTRMQGSGMSPEKIFGVNEL